MPLSQTRPATLLPGILLALALLLTACDGGPRSGPEEIRVGVLHSLTGPMAASEKPVLESTLHTIREINGQNLIPGVRIVPVVRDGGSDPALFARQAESLIRDDNVAAIFGCWTSASRKAVRPVVERYNSLLFYPLQYEGLENSPNIIYLGATPNQQILPSVYWARHALGKKRFFLVGSDYIFPRTANAIIQDQLRSLGGEVVGEAYLSLHATDPSAVIAQIKEAQPDIILNTLNGSINREFFIQLREAGITPDQIPTLSYSIGENELRDIGYRNIAGDYAAWNYFHTIDLPENHAWIASFRETHGDERVTSDPMEAAHIGVHLWAQALARARQSQPGTLAGRLSAEHIHQHLGHASHQAPGGHVFLHPQTRHLYKTSRIGQIEPNGHFRIVWESDVPVRPQPYPLFRSERAWEDFLTTLNQQWGGSWTAPHDSHGTP